MSKSLNLEPIGKINGTVYLPGSKSISNRVLLLSALAAGKTRLTNFLDSDDTRYMLEALKALGVRYTVSKNGTCCEVEGVNGPLNTPHPIELMTGNAGTVMRFLTAVLSLGQSDVVLTGGARMKERPMDPLVDALRQGNAQITYLEKKNSPPLRLRGGFRGGNLTLRGNISSQFLTALLIMAPLAEQDTAIEVQGFLVSKPYVEMTLHLMRVFGIRVTHKHYRTFNIKAHQKFKSPGHYRIEGDATAASYFLAAAAIKGGCVRVIGVGQKSIQGDVQFADVLQKMGAFIHWGEDYIECRPGRLKGIDMDMNSMPDAAMTLATTALFSEGPTRIQNIYNWRLKETDRLSAMSAELRKLGAQIKEGQDYIEIISPKNLKAAEIQTYNDHRIAMSFSLMALSDMPIRILNPRCTSKTFPDFFQKLAYLSGTV
ncbi:3-phosphoshikimate 1-carboxyvinyltransferase [Candidatus Hamiltonella defensa]|uniref:3-phosphoshikimate 1-carboxyvinyltransferase n=1 Tax=Candidatus Williamhamiltonella defendens TaxID=138072 RepID=UPI000D5FF730|nr:3-phosphoshikimate 1-carboxyvinyltransferase [Candidatus Hamiltonella defensa]AWK16435.1 3-phosphoshikimate 1-carboxyvinyltransferase [Candidatus Hamiltonella defensa]MBK4361572.1 3-phosphoshikimate 1-carboxyvinyltransferase [Candidatus Hamiltonella defensa]